MVTAKLARSISISLAIAAPMSAAGSFDKAAAARGVSNIQWQS